MQTIDVFVENLPGISPEHLCLIINKNNNKIIIIIIN